MEPSAPRSRRARRPARRPARDVVLLVSGLVVSASLAPTVAEVVRAAPATPAIEIAAVATQRADRIVLEPHVPTDGLVDAGPRFVTLPPGAALPGDAECAARVRPTAEIRPANAQANATRGIGPTLGSPRVTGDFSGTTDELLQWVACKWGIDEDVVRAQIAKESWWNQSAGGDRTGNAALCHPVLRGSLPCPESIGLGQVRFQYHGDAFAAENAIRSSAHNLDYTYSRWRECFEGQVGWLNNVERGATYAAGDMWGCVGVWFAGRWHTPDAAGYIAAVQGYLDQRIWETPSFANG